MMVFLFGWLLGFVDFVFGFAFWLVGFGFGGFGCFGLWFW